MLTAWDASIYSLGAVSTRPFSLTASFTMSVDAVCFFLTNVYAPSVREDMPAFFSEITSVASTVQGPWMLLGDFNLTRCPDDKNNDCFNASEANRFNDLINSLGLIEIPLVDRAYTWSNRRDVPTLVRLDRCFVNTDWDAVFPNTTLRSLTRFASDHVPILVSASTHVPRSACFRFENSWMHHRLFP
jgi:endonuclease/exonuclease/phosphatase family metal-dependent hydrolase